jgi:hypothetical protein
MSKSFIRNLLFSIAFLIYLSGCGQPESESGGSSVTVEPEGDGTALVSWLPPTENTDGSPLLDLAGYKIYYGTSSGSYTSNVNVSSPGTTSYLLEDLGSSDWYFAMTAYNSMGVESSYSPEVIKAIE